MKKKRRIKKKVYVIFGIIIALIIIITFSVKAIINHINYINSYEYKLGEIGYDEKQIEIILKLNDEQINEVLEKKYNPKMISFMKQKYFLYKNLKKYLEYQKENKSEKLSKIVSLVNVGANEEWYDEDTIKDTDISKGNLMLVNKFYHLNEDYVPENIVDVKNTYAYADNSVTEEVLEAFKNMWQKAKDDGLNLIITSSYRNYEDQDSIWSNYANSHSEEWADSYAARAGYSEHQTGLALDIVTYKSTMDNFDSSPEAKWLKENAYKYGFILRYPKDMEDLTGYDYEPWHYRYVGIENAKKIHDEGITFDEYYAYYIEK